MEKNSTKVDKTPQQLEEIFDGLNDSEKVGVAFGLFPARLGDLTVNDTIGLMKLREKKGPWTIFDEEDEEGRD